MPDNDPGLTRTQLAVNALHTASNDDSYKRPITGLIIIGLGFSILLVELVLQHWVRQQQLSWGVLGTGGFFVFCGYFAREPKYALRGGAFVVNSINTTVTNVGTMWRRKGRRADDPIVEVPIVGIGPETPSQEFPAPKIPPKPEG